MKKPVHIGLLVDASRAYGRGIYRGVANFAETRDDWIILAHERPELDTLPDWLKKDPPAQMRGSFSAPLRRESLAQAVEAPVV